MCSRNTSPVAPTSIRRSRRCGWSPTPLPTAGESCPAGTPSRSPGITCRMWATIMRDEFGAADPRSQMLRFHTQTAGVQLTAQQPEVNLARVTVQALAAVLGGTQSLHTNAYDEAIALPSGKAARLALRTQQVIAHETDLTATADPFAGSYAVESMTDDLESAASELITSVEELGGAVAAIEHGFQKAEIERSAYRIAREID